MVALATWGECSGFQDLESHPIHKTYKIWCFKSPGPTATCSQTLGVPITLMHAYSPNVLKELATKLRPIALEAGVRAAPTSQGAAASKKKKISGLGCRGLGFRVLEF